MRKKDPFFGMPPRHPLTIPTEFSQCIPAMQQLELLYKMKQDKLLAGENVILTDNHDGTYTISATGGEGSTVTVRVASTITGDPGTNAKVENIGTDQNVVLKFTIPRGNDGEDGQDGQDGESSTITIGTVTTGEAGSDASVTNSGTESAAVLDFVIPRGNTGASGNDGQDGAAATISVGTVTTGAAGSNASVTNSGTENAAVFDFVIPRGADGTNGSDGSDGEDGAAATISVGTVTTGSAGSNASVTNSGTENAAVFDFVIPRGADGSNGSDGSAATIAVGNVTTGAAGTNASVINSGTSSAAVLDFTIPRGADGTNGSDGSAATVAVGTVTTGAAGSNASVTNRGTANAAILDFTIPRGADGLDGQGIAATITVGTVTEGANAAVTNSGSSQNAVFDFVLPRGADGTDGSSATVAVGTVTTGAAGTNASVTNSGTSSAAVLDFTIPRGADGSNGNDGAAATIAVGNVATGAAGTNATVTNRGTANAAILDFTIPRGADGSNGNDGAAATVAVGNVATGAAGSSASVTNSGTNTAAILDFVIPTGADGADGTTPHIDSDTGNWFIGNTDTGVHAQGPAGVAKESIFKGTFSGYSSTYVPLTSDFSVTPSCDIAKTGDYYLPSIGIDSSGNTRFSPKSNIRVGGTSDSTYGEPRGLIRIRSIPSTITWNADTVHTFTVSTPSNFAITASAVSTAINQPGSLAIWTFEGYLSTDITMRFEIKMRVGITVSGGAYVASSCEFRIRPLSNISLVSGTNYMIYF